MRTAEAAKETLRNEAIQRAIMELIQNHRTEFESLVTNQCSQHGVSFKSEWLDRFYRGM